MLPVSLKPAFTKIDASKFAHNLYGLWVSARPLPGERDQNFLLTDQAGRQYVLKIANAAEDIQVLDFQNQIMNWLANKSRLGGCPEILQTKDGQLIAGVSGKDQRKHYVRLLTYVRGKKLVEVHPHSPNLLEGIGRYLGRFDIALIGFSHPAAQRSFQWSIWDSPKIIIDYSRYIERPNHQKIIKFLLEEFERQTWRELVALRSGIIHNDSNDHNLLVDTSGPNYSEISGLIDFGDMVESPYIQEVAVAAAYVMLNKLKPISNAAHVIRGYHRTFPLNEAEVIHIYDLICIRLCISACLSAYQRKESPENEYLSISEQPVLELLEKLIKLDRTNVVKEFLQTCDFEP
jgi:Ser/Thr protein kinase RdoA (MazF antagonist)